jgi:hypothetical protein
MQIFVKCSGGKHIIIEVDPEDKIVNVKAQIQAKTKIPSHDQRLIFSNQQLKNENKVKDYSINKHSTLLLARLRGEGPFYLYCKDKNSDHSFHYYLEKEFNSTDTIEKIKIEIYEDLHQKCIAFFALSEFSATFMGNTLQDNTTLISLNLGSHSTLIFYFNGSSKPLNIKIEFPDGSEFSILSTSSETILNLKKRISYSKEIPIYKFDLQYESTLLVNKSKNFQIMELMIAVKLL